MPGHSHRFTQKEDKLAKMIREEYIRRGYDTKTSNSIAYASINKMRRERKQKVIIDGRSFNL